MKPNQKTLIIRELAKGRSLTVLTALQRLGVYALSQRIGELKRERWKIKRTMVKTPSGARVASYSL